MAEEVIYILSKSGFSIFSPCYCLESTAPTHGSLACVSLVPFQKGKNNYGNFFVVKIVTQWNPISSFFSSWWNLKATRHRFLNLNYACQRLVWSRRLESAKPSAVRCAPVPERDRAGQAGGGNGDTPSWSVGGSTSHQTLRCPRESWTLNYRERQMHRVTALCSSSSFCLSFSLLSFFSESFPKCLMAILPIQINDYFSLAVQMMVLGFSQSEALLVLIGEQWEPLWRGMKLPGRCLDRFLWQTAVHHWSEGAMGGCFGADRKRHWGRWELELGNGCAHGEGELESRAICKEGYGKGGIPNVVQGLDFSQGRGLCFLS